jgi:hypothetical protein
MKKQILEAAALAFASFGAFAADNTTSNVTAVQWTYVEAAAARTSLDADDETPTIDFDGWKIAGSVEFADEYHVFGAFQQTDNNEFLPMDLEEIQLGFGWHPKISANANAVLETSYIRQSLDVDFLGDSIEASDDLYRFSGGVRGAFGEHFLGSIKGHYTDSSDVDGEFSASVGAEVRFNRTWSLVGEAELGEELNHYSVGVRASF